MNLLRERLINSVTDTHDGIQKQNISEPGIADQGLYDNSPEITTLHVQKHHIHRSSTLAQH